MVVRRGKVEGFESVDGVRLRAVGRVVCCCGFVGVVDDVVRAVDGGGEGGGRTRSA